MPLVLSLKKYSTFDKDGIFAAAGVFIAFVLTAKVGQYIFFVEKSSPALIWAPVGISLAAVLLWGYRMWLPIFMAQLAISPAAFAEAPIIIGLATGVGYASQAVIGAYILKRFGFKGTMDTGKDAMLLILAAMFVTIIAPTISAMSQLLVHTMPFTQTAIWTYLTRVWAGGVLSVLVMTPLITTFFLNRNWQLSSKKVFETSVAFLLLVFSIYLLFWTTLPQTYAFPLIYLLCTLLFWVSLRFGARSMSMALFLLTALGVAGSIIAHPSATPVNFQLFADELFIILLAPIFQIFVAVIEERRATAGDLESSIVQLQEAMHRLSMDDKSKNEFIAILAHELRNPLSPVMSTLELLALEEHISPGTRQMVESAQTQTFAMRRLLDDLLDVARVAQQKFKLQKEVIDIGSIVTRSVENTRSFIAAKGHSLVISLPPSRIELDADAIRLEQIIVNLLNNAAKYTPRGGIISLTVGLEEGCLAIRVADNGMGIPTEQLESIFQPFNQVLATSAPHNGLGIGLSLTRRLVEMHHGTVSAYSEGLGKGSVFRVLLPVKEREMSLFEHKPIAESTPVLSHLNSAFKILVVDDNEPAAMGLGKLLQHKGHQVSFAHTGESAIVVASTFDPHVILLDIGLPDITGYEVAGRLRGGVQGSLVKLIALTGYGQEEDKQRAFAAGFDHHLTKPVSVKDVEKLLSRV